MLNVIIEYQNISQSLHNQFVDATQNQVAESTGEHNLFQMLGKVNSSSNVRNLSNFFNFEKTFKLYNKSRTLT